MNMIYRTILFFIMVLSHMLLHAEDWPQFRGPNSNQLPTSKNLPQEWDKDTNIAWQAEIPGEGWSSPIVSGNKVFVTTAVLDETTVQNDSVNQQSGRRRSRPKDAVYSWELYCLDFDTGKQIWQRTLYKGKPSYQTHRDNTYASETPVTDGERIYVYYGMMGLYCYDFDGTLIWKKDLGVYAMQSNWGTSTSPFLYKGKLYMQIDSEENSFLVNLDPETGNENWRVAREERSSWSTPIIWKNKARTELVTGGGDKVRAYAPNSGQLIWELATEGGRNISSPVTSPDLLYTGNEERRSGGGVLFAIKAGAAGDISLKEGESTSSGVAWSLPGAGLSMASPLLYQGLLYLVDRRGGFINCYNATTGEAMYQRVRIPDAKAFWATPWAYDGKIFCLDDTGITHVLQAGPEFKVLYQNILEDKFWASAALVDGAIILRGQNTLYCIRDSN